MNSLLKVANQSSSLHKIIPDNIVSEANPKVTLKFSNKKEQQNKKSYTCIQIFADKVYVGTRSSKLYIYELEGNNLKNQSFINPHCQIIFSVIANDKYIITVPQSDEDSELSVWDAFTRNFITAFKGHKSQISKVIFMRTSNLIASASWDGSVRIWSLQDLGNDSQKVLYQVTYPILELAQINKDVLVFGGDDCYLTFWSWKSDKTVWTIDKMFGHAGSVTYIYTIPPYMLTCGGDNKFKIWQDKPKKEDKKKSNLQELQVQLGDLQQSKVLLQTCNFCLINQIKQQYDSTIYGCQINSKSLFLIDRQGEAFIYGKQSIDKLKNEYEYNQNVTGVARYGNYLFMTTTKGFVKIFQIAIQQPPKIMQQPKLIQQPIQDKS